MNVLFKDEFKNLKPSEIKRIINGCAGKDILEKNMNETLKLSDTSYFIKYIEDDNYGFWSVQWRWKKFSHPNMPMSTGMFENSMKITPFRVELEKKESLYNPFISSSKIKNLEEYLFIYIHKSCPNYINAIKEETERFIGMLTMDNVKKSSR